jgi:transcriptional regulator with PAS, ATPase and Fis domain
MELEQVKNIINKINDYCCVLDSHGIILISNKSFLNIYNTDKKNISGKKYTDVFPLTRPKEFLLNLDLVIADGLERNVEDFSSLLNKRAIISLAKFYKYVVITISKVDAA